MDRGSSAPTGKPFTFIVDATACGWGDAKIDVTLEGRSVPSKTLEVDRSLYEVTFTPLEAAKYKIYVYFNGHEVKGLLGKIVYFIDYIFISFLCGY